MESSIWQTYYHKLFKKGGWFDQIEIRVMLAQESTYLNHLEEILRQ